MTHIYNIYCDESSHLERDQRNVMVLGALWCPIEKTREIAIAIRDIKEKHGLPPNDFEVKWKKVSPSKVQFYEELVDYFFSNADLHFRALVVLDKSKLRHELFFQTHDDWYFKMYFDLLKVIISPDNRYRIYLDIKDTRSASKVEKLHEVLSNANYDFERKIIDLIQTVRSHEVEQIQLADLLIGAIAYINHGHKTSKAKLQVIDRIQQLSGYKLTQSTLLSERKLNIFCWEAQEFSGE